MNQISKLVLINVLVVSGLLLLWEGMASVLLAYSNASAKSSYPVAEARHTTFDPLLGWINKPGVRIENMYGEGVYLRTNDQGFRNEADTAKTSDRTRILCVGDSFTLGYGVANGETWCDLLENRVTPTETVNMGQGGYGVDQAYLWYKRDGSVLEHDLMIFAFITADFYRMQETELLGVSKPFLSVTSGELKITPPVQRATDDRESTGHLSSLLSQLQMTKLMRKLIWKFRLWDSLDGVLSNDARNVTAAMFADIVQLAERQDAKILLVYLPNADDYPANIRTDMLRRSIAELAFGSGLNFVDLVEVLQELPSSFDAHRLFQYGNNHYNADGNLFIAEHLSNAINNALPSEEREWAGEAPD